MKNFQKKISLVLIHGWGCDQSSWQPLRSELERLFTLTLIDLPGFGSASIAHDYSLDKTLSILNHQIPDNSWLMGWSLGGMLAIRLAQHYPQKILGVISLAANAKFVAETDYPDAMSLQVNQQFNHSFIENPLAALKVFSGLLAQGAEDERALLKQFRKMLQPENIHSSWYDALILLSQIDNRHAISELTQPCMHIFADADSLVPVSAASCVKQLNPRHQVNIIERSSHALHWCHPIAVLTLIREFILNSYSHKNPEGSRSTDEWVANVESVQQATKSRVAKKFSRAASTYDQAAEIQAIAGNRLFNEYGIGLQLSDDSVIMDLGCGTGFFLDKLQKHFHPALMLGVDLSFDMLLAAQKKSSGLWVAGDAEKLPFSANSVDLIYSNFALQWCFNLPLLLDELCRVLKPGGELIFTTLGSQSLYELASAWREVDSQPHTNQFVDKGLMRALLETRFTAVRLDSQLLEMQFDTIHDLLRSLKSVGATYHAAANQGLMGRKKFIQLAGAYEQFRKHGKDGKSEKLPLTYDVIFVRATKRAN